MRGGKDVLEVTACPPAKLKTPSSQDLSLVALCLLMPGLAQAPARVGAGVGLGHTQAQGMSH